MKPKQWTVAARRRLYAKVSPRKEKCRYCRGGRCDVLGEHQVTSPALGSRIYRHDAVTNFIAQELRNVGIEFTIEQNGGSGERVRPVDIKKLIGTG